MWNFNLGLTMPTNQKWTGEPWTIYHVPDGHVVYGDKGARVIFAYQYSEPEDTANTQRIVDCVNALKGIENPAAYLKSLQDLFELSQQVKPLAEEFNRLSREPAGRCNLEDEWSEYSKQNDEWEREFDKLMKQIESLTTPK